MIAKPKRLLLKPKWLFTIGFPIAGLITTIFYAYKMLALGNWTARNDLRGTCLNAVVSMVNNLIVAF